MKLHTHSFVSALPLLLATHALAQQQIGRAARILALEAATKARGVGDSSAIVMKLAKEFLEFLEPPAPKPEPAPVLDGVDREEGATSH